MISTNKKHTILYSETYQKVYTIEADNAEEAKAILYQRIGEGSENSPEECVDSSMEVLHPFYFTFGSDKSFPYQNGYIIIFAKYEYIALRVFREHYSGKSQGCVSCSAFYSEKEWQQTAMARNNNYPCFETIYAHEEKIPGFALELIDTKYTWEDLVSLCKGNEELTRIVCDASDDYRHPETVIDEMLREGDVAICPKCGYYKNVENVAL